MANKNIRKQSWVNRFTPDILKGDPINVNVANEVRYYHQLVPLIDKMTIETENELRNLFNSEEARVYFAQDKSIAVQARILTRALTNKFNDLFATNAPRIAKSVADDADKSSKAAVQSSIQKLSGGLSLSTASLTTGPLKDILIATIAENVSLIKSISSEYLSGVEGAVMRSITTGNGLQDLVPYLAKHKEITLRRARMIALDQNRKAMNNLAKGRMQAIGIKEYEWLHTMGSKHPRKEHIAMSGNIYKFDEPPVIDEKTGERGIPGQLVNCRCRMVAVINFGAK